MKKIIASILSFALILSVLSPVCVSADKYDIDVNETLKTTRTVSDYNSSFLSVTGYAKGVVNDRTEYIGTSYYRTVSNGDEFVQALADASKGNVKVIEVTADIDLGYHTLSEASQNSGCIEIFDDPASAYSTGKYTNPTIKQSGASKVSINSTDGLTIFSTEGYTIRHGMFKIQYGCNDIVIRNLRFDDMWQWDEAGTHKEAGWAFFKVNGAKNVWIDHCTFTIAADALIDLENASSGVTYSWNRFSLEADTPDNTDPVYKTISYMEYLYKNNLVDKNGRYYKTRASYRYDTDTIMRYESFHSKCFGVGNEKQFKDLGSGNMPYDSAQRVRLTMAYNHLVNVGQRVPRLSVGRVHMFNMVIDNESHVRMKQQNSSLASIGGVSLRSNKCIDVHTSGSCAADTCIFNYVEGAIVGREYQGFETSGTGLSADPVLSFAWRDAKNRALAINSKIVTPSGQEYIGSSWDNNGENPLIESDYWNINEISNDINGTAKSTIGNWAWQTDITNVDDMEGRKVPAGFIFEFEDNFDATLGYDYQTLTLDDTEELIPKYSGAYALTMSAEDWLRVSYNETEEGITYNAPDAKVKAEKLEIRQDNQIIPVNELFQLDVNIYPGNTSNRNVTWTSSNPDVMEVLESGLVIVKTNGEATFTATTQDGTNLSDTVTLKAEIAVSGISLNYKSKSVNVGDTLQAIATIEPENAANKNVIWKSSNESVAMVNEDGFIIPQKAGNAIITAMSAEDETIKATLTLKVKGEGTPATPTPLPTATPEVTVSPYTLGDVNEDASIDASDALAVLKHAAKLEILDDISAADINKDENADASDALEILKYAAKIIDGFDY